MNRFIDVDRGVARDPSLNTFATSNEEAFRRILSIYARPGFVIADLTLGQGVFWKLVDKSIYTLCLTDITTHNIDCRATGYPDEAFDMVVLDPPYRYAPAKSVAHMNGRLHDRYRLQESGLENIGAVLDFYFESIWEARRIVRHGGFVVVKCQDTVANGQQKWVHIEIMQYAQGVAELACRDILIVATSKVKPSRWEFQKHLLKTHSYFLVFRKGGAFPFGMTTAERSKRT